MRRSAALIGCIASFLLFSCEKYEDIDDIITKEEQTITFVVDTSYYNYAQGVENALNKARQIAGIAWKPLGPIPLWGVDGNSFYKEGRTYKGLPYSSVKEVDTYVGHNVSFYTFMTAVNNPRSRLYTVDLSQPPYHGVSCATYYGTVCSMSVNYALGIDAPYICRDYPNIGFEEIVPQTIEAIRICDVLWRQTHVMMIYDIERDTETNTVSNISIFEVNTIKQYSREEFLAKWNDGNFTVRRYKYLGGNLRNNSFIGDNFLQDQDIVYNTDICPDKGDKTCYRVGEPVEIDVLNPYFDKVVIETPDHLVLESTVDEGKCVFDNLPPGIYTAKAVQGKEQSDAASFEVIDTNVSVSQNGNIMNVFFNSQNGLPQYAILCSVTGGKYALKQLSQPEVAAGRIQINRPDADSCFVKVAFKGEYGIITNSPICVR